MSNTQVLLSQIRDDLEQLVGEEVRVKANQGRRRTMVREGTLEKTYPSVFVIRLGSEQQHRRISYTYTDVLTETVELTVLADSGSRTLAYSAS